MHDLNDQAKLTEAWIVSSTAAANRFYLVPESDPLQPADSAPQLEKFWYQKFRQVRSEHAERLFQHANEFLKHDQAPAAYHVLHEILREDPDHAEARRILGYRRIGETWRRPGVTVRAKQPRFDHPLYDWPSQTYWQIDTPHFQILTNHSEQAGLKLGQRLEIVYSVWEQLFFSFWSNSRQLASYFDGKSPTPARKKFQVVYFKSQEEYVRYLLPSEPRIGITRGIYQFQPQKVFLFHNDDPAAYSTWHHEVAHQLFQEYRSTSEEVGNSYNAWAVEGAAMYLESMRIHDGYVTTGGITAPRLQFARNRRLVGDFYLPLGKLVRLGRLELQQDPNISAIYSQSAGLAQFFIDGRQKKLREPFVAYLVALYHDRDTPDSLSELTGQPLPQLDAWYQEFLFVNNQQIVTLPAGFGCSSLALGNTQVTDEALSRIGTFKQLAWLDLTGTRVTDAGVKHLSGCHNLSDLSLASTQATDESLPTIGQLISLVELDLSNTRVTDDSLKQLAGLQKLQILRLALTGIGDPGLSHLGQLASLRMIDLRRTQVSATAVATFRERFPEVEIFVDTP